MNPVAIEHAKARLEKAKRAVDILHRTAKLDEKESAWSDFLLASSGIYSKLEQGSKSKSSSAGWFGRKKSERKNDPLLRYIHHARNSDEHGVEQITRADPGGFGINPADPTRPISMVINPEGVPRLPGEIRIHNLDPSNPLLVKRIEPSLKLVRVRDSRYGDSFDPPTSHFGQSVDGTSLVTVAELALRYLENLIEDAEKL